MDVWTIISFVVQNVHEWTIQQTFESCYLNPVWSNDFISIEKKKSGSCFLCCCFFNYIFLFGLLPENGSHWFCTNRIVRNRRTPTYGLVCKPICKNPDKKKLINRLLVAVFSFKCQIVCLLPQIGTINMKRVRATFMSTSSTRSHDGTFPNPSWATFSFTSSSNYLHHHHDPSWCV